MTEQEICDQLAGLERAIEAKFGAPPYMSASLHLRNGLAGQTQASVNLYKPKEADGYDLWRGSAGTIEDVLEDAWVFVRDLPSPEDAQRFEDMDLIARAADAAERIGGPRETVAEFRRAHHRLAMELGAAHDH